MSNRPLVFTADRLLHILQSYPVATAYVVGFSGGADSTALLHALSVVKDQLDVPLSAVHVNHGLHGDAGVWQSHCDDFCRNNAIDLISLNIELEHDTGKGIEAEARHLRYEAISALLTPGACLLTAHHADDQAETLLLNLMRGSGIDGLSAMPESRRLGDGFLQRPMLSFRASTLRDYLRENDIEWTEDPSNRYLNHDRNFLRHEIIPLLEQRWPEVSKRLLLTRSAMTGARHLLERLADENLEQNLGHPYVFQMTSKLFDDPELFKLVIRRWMKTVAVPSIPVYRMETFCKQVQRAGSGQKVTINWGGWLLRLYQQKLWLCKDEAISSCPNLIWSTEFAEVDLGHDSGQLVMTLPGETGKPANPTGEFYVGGRNNIGATAISQGSHHKSLKNLFQSAGIPPFLRDCIPLCKLNDELVAVGDWCFSERFTVWMSENNINLSWRPRHPLLQYIREQQHQAGL